MEYFQYFEVSKFPSLLEVSGMRPEDFDELKDLGLGDGLNLIEFLEKIEHLLNDAA